MSRGSHPPTLLTLVGRALRSLRLPRGTSILVAVSGGPDSQALLHVLATLAPRHGLAVVAHGIDHGLRAHAAHELSLAATLAGKLGVPFGTTRVTLPGPAGPSNLQARARAARYEALRHAARTQGCAVIATGHHADDRAETVLIRILRGAAPAGLSVLPLRAGDLIRPLLAARRVDVLAHVRRHHLPFSEDPSNRDPRFLRTRVRDEVMPLLESLSPRIVRHLSSLADELSLAHTSPPDGTPTALRGASGRVDAARLSPFFDEERLPRATRKALRELVARSVEDPPIRARRGKKASVLLPGGLVVTARRGQVLPVNESHDEGAVASGDVGPRWRHRSPRPAPRPGSEQAAGTEASTRHRKGRKAT